MDDGICRQMDTDLPEHAYETRRGGRCMMRIGENESPFATQRNQLIGDFVYGSESEKNARW
jgi:hypothetical protein